MQMGDFDRKDHWEQIYSSKSLSEVSWYQPTPETSLSLIQSFGLPKDARIIDIGGGDSLLVDHLLDEGYSNLSVLDISEKAIQRAQKRLGDRSRSVNWIISDVVGFQPEGKYDLWHDRAAFHFLTEEKEVDHYLETARAALLPSGYLIVGTFSENGPKKCSGIEVHQYSERSMTKRFSTFFDRIRCIVEDHLTPAGKVQNFIFCSFQRITH